MATESEKNWIDAVQVGSDYRTMQEFTGDGVTDTFEVNFTGGYLNIAHVKGESLDTVNGVRTILELEFVGRNTFKVRPVPGDGHTVTLYRDTPKAVPLLSFVDGAMITAPNLDRNAKQAIFAVAEMLDRFGIAYKQVELAEMYSIAARVAATEAAASAQFVDSIYKRFEITDTMIEQIERAKLDSQSAAGLSNASADRAEAASQAALGASNLYQDHAEAQAKIASGVIPAGGYFYIISQSDSEIALLYRNVNGTITPVVTANGVQKSIPTKQALDVILKLIQEKTNLVPILALADARGYVGFQVEQRGTIKSGQHIEIAPEGITLADVSVSTDVLALGGLRMERAEGVGLRLVGDGGFFIDIIGADGKPAWADFKPDPGPGPDPEPAGFDERAFMREIAGIAKGVSARRMQEKNFRVQAPTCQYNHYFMYGQSLSTGYEGWPALTGIDLRLGNVMFGDAPRPQSGGAPAYLPIGGNRFSPLQAVVTGGGNNRPILSEIEVANLKRGAGNEGESPIVSCVNYIRKQYLSIRGLHTDPEHLFIASCTGVAGKSIEALSKGANPELFNRFVEALERSKALADAEGKTYCVPAIFFAQGEWNYNTNGTNDYQAYLDLLDKLRKDMIAEVYRVCGDAQTDDPAFIIYQTGGTYTSRTDELNVGRAQQDWANATPGVFLSCPVYQFTDKGGHLDPNGYRAFGQKMGETYVVSCLLREGWLPTQSYAYFRKGDTIYGSFLAQNELNWDTPYYIGSPKTYSQRGFVVKDASNAVVPILSVDLFEGSVVRIKLDRDPGRAVDVIYGDKNRHDGNGMLVDMGRTAAIYDYLWTDGNGQYPEHNVPELVNKPSEMRNWCTAHRTTVEVI